MKLLLSLLFLAEALTQGSAYTRCTYSYYDSLRGKRMTSYYRCSSHDYCCGAQSCCTPVYSRWYLWFVVSSFFFIMLLIWWYYRHRSRPRQAVLANPHAVPAPTGVSTFSTYPSTGQVTMINPNAGVVHYTTHPAYPGAVLNPYPMQAAPPPYSVVVANR